MLLRRHLLQGPLPSAGRSRLVARGAPPPPPTAGAPLCLQRPSGAALAVALVVIIGVTISASSRRAVPLVVQEFSQHVEQFEALVALSLCDR